MGAAAASLRGLARRVSARAGAAMTRSSADVLAQADGGASAASPRSPVLRQRVDRPAFALRSKQALIDTQERHQRSWTLADGDVRFGMFRPRPATVLDILAMLCKQGVRGSSPLSSTRAHHPGQTLMSAVDHRGLTTAAVSAGSFLRLTGAR